MIVNLDVWSDCKSLKFWSKEKFRYFTLVDIAFEIEWCFNDG